jgi:hypothetical protein
VLSYGPPLIVVVGRRDAGDEMGDASPPRGQTSPAKRSAAWAAAFRRAVKLLEQRGIIEFPGLVPLAHDEIDVAMHLADGLYLSDRKRQRRFGRLTSVALR